MCGFTGASPLLAAVLAQQQQLVPATTAAVVASATATTTTALVAAVAVSNAANQQITGDGAPCTESATNKIKSEQLPSSMLLLQPQVCTLGSW